MASRPTASSSELPGMVESRDQAEFDAGPQKSGQALARLARPDRSEGPSKRGRRGETFRSVQGLSSRNARRSTFALDASAWTISHARRSCWLSGTDVLSAWREGRGSFSARLAVHDDGAALRGL